MHRPVARLVLTVATLLIATMGAQEAQAQVKFGPVAAFGNDFDFAVGGRVQADIDAFGEEGALDDLRGIGEFLYYLDPVDNCDDCSLWEANVNGAIPFTLGESDADFYAGGGLNIARFSFDTGIAGFDASSTEIGLNILGGINFDLGSVGAFGEASIKLNGSEQFVIAGGILFGGSGDDGM